MLICLGRIGSHAYAALTLPHLPCDMHTQGTGLDMAQGRPPVCPVCHGSGEILRTVWRPVGMRVPQLGTCPACGGSGTQAREACSR
jgi:DnaJ-class molecular chaperone